MLQDQNAKTLSQALEKSVNITVQKVDGFLYGFRSRGANINRYLVDETEVDHGIGGWYFGEDLGVADVYEK